MGLRKVLSKRKYKKKATHFVEDLQNEVNFELADLKHLEAAFLEEAGDDGFVDKKQLANVFKKLAPKAKEHNLLWQVDPKELASHLFPLFDLDGNGVIEFHELLLGFNAYTKATPSQKGKWSFRLADHNGDGQLDPGELCELVRLSITCNIRLAPLLAEITAAQSSFTPAQAKTIRATAEMYSREMEKQIPHITATVGKEILDLADTDGDGLVSEQEWRELCSVRDIHEIMQGAKKPPKQSPRAQEMVTQKIEEAQEEKTSRLQAIATAMYNASYDSDDDDSDDDDDSSEA